MTNGKTRDCQRNIYGRNKLLALLFAAAGYALYLISGWGLDNLRQAGADLWVLPWRNTLLTTLHFALLLPVYGLASRLLLRSYKCPFSLRTVHWPQHWRMTWLPLAPAACILFALVVAALLHGPIDKDLLYWYLNHQGMSIWGWVESFIDCLVIALCQSFVLSAFSKGFGQNASMTLMIALFALRIPLLTVLYSWSLYDTGFFGEDFALATIYRILFYFFQGMVVWRWQSFWIGGVGCGLFTASVAIMVNAFSFMGGQYRQLAGGYTLFGTSSRIGTAAIALGTFLLCILLRWEKRVKKPSFTAPVLPPLTQEHT